MNPTPRLFLDASVLIAAAGSKSGASALILELCRRSRAKAISSQLVLLEAERNIRTKLVRDALLRFYQEIATVDLELLERPAEHEIAVQREIIDPKHAHVLAAAVKGNVDFLLTLDRKHFMSHKVLHAGLPFRILTPGAAPSVFTS
ncbi:PIN domain-containing protein [Acidobacteria bacterium AH-259-L09]|nr:PIN domain-containing protein [Acidobacteria bacterium AH-259-L09]